MTEKNQGTISPTLPLANRRQFSSRVLLGLMGAVAVGTPPIHNNIKSWINNNQLLLDKELSEAIGQQDIFSALQCIEKGADVNFVAEKGYPMLSKAAWYGNPDMIQLLVDQGANIAATDEHQRTALHCAVDHVLAASANADLNFRLVNSLLNVMDEVVSNAKNTKGETALSTLLEKSFSHVSECRRLGTTSHTKLLSGLQQCMNITNLMIQKGCNPNKQDKENIAKLNTLILEYEERHIPPLTHHISDPKIKGTQTAAAGMEYP